jgi:hypothetical protein
MSLISWIVQDQMFKKKNIITDYEWIQSTVYLELLNMYWNVLQLNEFHNVKWHLLSSETEKPAWGN